jgi:hypothetical protein
MFENEINESENVVTINREKDDEETLLIEKKFKKTNILLIFHK